MRRRTEAAIPTRRSSIRPTVSIRRRSEAAISAGRDVASISIARVGRIEPTSVLTESRSIARSAIAHSTLTTRRRACARTLHVAASARREFATRAASRRKPAHVALLHRLPQICRLLLE